MSNKKKPKKKHSPKKRLQRQLNDIRIHCWQSDYTEDDYTPFVTIEARLHPLAGYKILGERHAKPLATISFNWKLCARALCTNGTDVWLETIEHIAKETPLNKLSEVYREMEKEVINAQQLRHVVDVGWIATTFDKNPDANDKWVYAHLGEATEQRRLLFRIAKLNHDQEERAA